jgi:hypothetical protein
MTANPPAGTVGAGTRMLVSGSAGVSNSGLFGLRAFNVAGNTGTYLASRSPPTLENSASRISTRPAPSPRHWCAPSKALMEISLGVEKAEQAKLTPHCNVDMAAAWENLSLTVQRVDITNLRGDESRIC